MADHLWLDDDPMPSCDPCMDGQHDECPDLITTAPYGVHACGCTNHAHPERTPA